MTSRRITWILFDLGNVLVDLRTGGLERAAAALGASAEQLSTIFNESDVGARIITGRMEPQEFVDRLNRQFRSAAAIGDIVNWFGPEVNIVFPEIPALIASLKKRYSLGILSNTFFGHWDWFIRTDFARRFDLPMASHLLGFRKPDPRIYRAALDRMGARAGETLFVDDLAENVEAAQALGFSAFQSMTPAELIAGLQREGALRGDDSMNDGK